MDRRKPKKSKFERKAAMFRRQDGRCYWCGCQMALTKRGPKSGPLASNEATIDHIDPRHSPERGQHPGEFRLVAACNACNQQRNREFEQATPIEVLRARSGCHGEKDHPK